jgi:putative acetyltransferase
MSEGFLSTGATRLRVAIPADTVAIFEVHKASLIGLCGTHYDTETLSAWMSRRSPEGYLPAIEASEMFVIEVESQVVAFGHAVPGRIEAIFVSPSASGKGHGRLLLTEAVKRASSSLAGVVTLKATLNAVAFYEKFGFEQVEPLMLKRGPVAVPHVLMKGTFGCPMYPDYK